MSDLEEQKPGVSRRTVAKAMAWSVPAVALAVPAPAYAASPGVVTLTGAGCKLPGGSNDTYKGYAFRAVLSNTTNAPVTVTITDMDLGASDLGNVAIVNLSPCALLGTNTFIIPANTTLSNVAFVTQNAANSENGTLLVTFTVEGVPDQATATAAGLPPIQGAQCRNNVFSTGEADCINSFAV
ncbi:hypothetical protein LQ757_01905 [Agromyces sp. SYSU K20354]|uniref:hypothetical protein n=1 Tax=Agromyces cavernae TaxID=2898659 RepID=UPI001E51F475|nr:hypothetical protein [Agromyces cavernae]MCD2441020.1 hypothetical protein [Agromyces cavernae]